MPRSLLITTVLLLSIWFAGTAQAFQVEDPIPTRISIPTIGVDANVRPLTITNGTMQVPPNHRDVGWYEPLLAPGAGENVVMAGFNIFGSGVGVFDQLSTLAFEDQIIVELSDGSEFEYEVAWVRIYERATIPLEDVIGSTGVEELTLFTDEPPYDPATDSFDRITVIKAKWIATRRGGPQATIVSLEQERASLQATIDALRQVDATPAATPSR